MRPTPFGPDHTAFASYLLVNMSGDVEVGGHLEREIPWRFLLQLNTKTREYMVFDPRGLQNFVLTYRVSMEEMVTETFDSIEHVFRTFWPEVSGFKLTDNIPVQEERYVGHEGYASELDVCYLTVAVCKRFNFDNLMRFVFFFVTTHTYTRPVQRRACTLSCASASSRCGTTMHGCENSKRGERD